MSLKIDPLEGPGSTPLRRMFWNDVRDTVLTLRKREGRNVTVSEFDGYGTIVQVTRERGQAAPSDCPPPNPCTIDISWALPDWSFGVTGKPVAGDGTTEDGWTAEAWHIPENESDACWVSETYFQDVDNDVYVELGNYPADWFYTGSDVGWWLQVHVNVGPPSCSYEITATGNALFLGTDVSIFATDLVLASIPMHAINFACTGNTGTVDITYHPC